MPCPEGQQGSGKAGEVLGQEALACQLRQELVLGLASTRQGAGKVSQSGLAQESPRRPFLSEVLVP